MPDVTLKDIKKLNPGDAMYSVKEGDWYIGRSSDNGHYIINVRGHNEISCVNAITALSLLNRKPSDRTPRPATRMTGNWR